jgi:hypothetical protein
MFRSNRVKDALLSADSSLISKKMQRSSAVAPLSLRLSRMRSTKLVRAATIPPYLLGLSGSLFPDTSKTLSCQIHIVARLLRGAYRHYRVMFGLTVNGQKTRSNAKTMRRMPLSSTIKVLTCLRLSKKSVGKIFGDSAKAKRLRSKLRPSAKGAKSKSQKKRPTVRSRDSKKSVWA